MTLIWISVIKHGLVLLYDNHGRGDVARSLCRYLEHQCACTIVVSLDATYASKDKEWLVLQLRRADCELIIDSEGAVRHFKYNMIETDVSTLNRGYQILSHIDYLSSFLPPPNEWEGAAECPVHWLLCSSLQAPEALCLHFFVWLCVYPFIHSCVCHTPEVSTHFLPTAYAYGVDWYSVGALLTSTLPGYR